METVVPEDRLAPYIFLDSYKELAVLFYSSNLTLEIFGQEFEQSLEQVLIAPR